MRIWLSAVVLVGVALGTEAAAGDGDNPQTAASQTASSQAEPETGRSSGGTAQRPGDAYLGLFADPVGPALAAQLSAHLQAGAGLLVTRVLPDSPAARAGLQQFDVLAEYDGQALTGVEQFQTLLAGDAPGRAVKLAILRNARPRTIEATLGRRPRDRAQQKHRRLSGASPREGHRPRAEDEIRRAEAETPSSAVPVPPRSQSISLVVGGAGPLRLKAVYLGATGEPCEAAFAGPRAELNRQLPAWPEPLRDEVRRLLDRADELEKRNCAFQFRLQPQVEAGRRSLRIFIQRPGADGAVHVFEADHPLDEAEFQADRLLRIEGVARELEELAPAIRAQVENTLRKIQAPEKAPAADDAF